MALTQNSRLRLRFGIRKLILAVFMVALGLWFVRSELQRRSIESQAVRELENCGATMSDFLFRIDSQGRLAPDYSAQAEPPILDSLFGESPARSVLKIEMSHCDNANEAFTYLPLFVNAKWISINDARFCDRHLVRCTELRHVERLDIADTQVSNDGLVALRGWAHMKQLDRSATDVSDDGLKHLSGLTSLERLTLRDTKISGAGLKHLRPLQLKWLNVSHTSIDDDDIGSLVALDCLEMLDVKSTMISDEGMIELKQAFPQCDVWDGH